MHRVPPSSRQRLSHTVLLAFLALFTRTLNAEGCGLVNLSGPQSGCPGQMVVFQLLAVCDNCNCAVGTNVPTLPIPGVFALTPVSVVSDPAAPDWPAGFVNAPGFTVVNPCTPGLPVTCTGIPFPPATAFSFAIITVAVMIPANASAGQTDTHTVTVNFGPGAIVPGNKQVDITTTVLPATACGGPPNDDCAGAIVVVDGVNGPFVNTGATYGAQAFPCGRNSGPDVWFEYTATTTGTLQIDTCSNARTFDTVLEVFEGTCGALNPGGCNDDACGLGSRVDLAATAGTTYLVHVGGYNGQVGTFELTIGYTTTGTFTQVDPGCGTTLVAAGPPDIGNLVSFALVGPGTIPVIWLGLTNPSLPICPGCTLASMLDFMFPTNLLQIALPNDPALVGGTFFAQGAKLGPAIGGCSLGGLDAQLSNAIEIVVGT